MTDQRKNIEYLINKEVEYLAKSMNAGVIDLADRKLDKLHGILTASYYADIITTKEYNYIFDACLAIRFGKEVIV